MAPDAMDSDADLVLLRTVPDAGLASLLSAFLEEVGIPCRVEAPANEPEASASPDRAAPAGEPAGAAGWKVLVPADRLDAARRVVGDLLVGSARRAPAAGEAADEASPGPVEDAVSPGASATPVPPTSAPAGAPEAKDPLARWELAAVLVGLVVPSLFGSFASVFSASPLWSSSPRDVLHENAWTLVTCTGEISILLFVMARSGLGWGAFGLRGDRPGIDLASGILLFAIVWGGEGAILAAIFPGGGPTREAWVIAGTAQWAVVIVAVAASALSQELLYRGYLLVRLEGLLGSPERALGVSSLLFGLVHAYQGLEGVVGATFIGIVYGFVFLVFRRIWPLAVAHAAHTLAIYWIWHSGV